MKTSSPSLLETPARTDTGFGTLGAPFACESLLLSINVPSGERRLRPARFHRNGRLQQSFATPTGYREAPPALGGLPSPHRGDRADHRFLASSSPAPDLPVPRLMNLSRIPLFMGTQLGYPFWTLRWQDGIGDFDKSRGGVTRLHEQQPAYQNTKTVNGCCCPDR